MTGGQSDRDTCRFLEKSGLRKLLKRERLIEESRLWNACFEDISTFGLNLP